MLSRGKGLECHIVHDFTIASLNRRILEKTGHIMTKADSIGATAVTASRFFGYLGLALFAMDIIDEAYFYGWKKPRDFDNDGFVG